jgi:hypothetical protein
MSNKKYSKFRSIISFIVAGIFLVAAGWAVLNRQYVLDLINYNLYKPNSMIVSFAEKSSMNDEGKFLFYSAQPSLAERDDFNKSCPNHSGGALAILGCYDGQKIYIYNISNPKLDGIRQETAAYEMLHAAYKRITGEDKTKLDSLIEAEYKNQATSDTEAAVTYFAKYEPNDRDNELFSVIATQFSTINPQLESYYSRFFTNRQTLVALYDSYSSVFTGLKSQSDDLYNEITTLGKQITTDKASYNQESIQLQSDITTFNQQARSGTMTQYEYNTSRSSLETRIAQLSSDRQAVNEKITTYNNELSQYQALSLQVKTLNQSIDSSLSPAPSL